jgi:Fe-S-cluster containining protein
MSQDVTKGKCCKNLGISVSPAELEASYRKFVERFHKGPSVEDHERPLANYGEPAAQGLHHPPRGVPMYKDIHLVYPMLEFLYQDFTHPNGNTESRSPVYHYRCKHSNDKLGKCDIHAIRPDMCVTFPIGNGTVCKYKGCACPGDGRKEEAERLARAKKQQEDLEKKRKLCLKKPLRKGDDMKAEEGLPCSSS